MARCHVAAGHVCCTITETLTRDSLLFFLFHWIINLNAVFKVRMQMATLGTHKPGIKTEHAQIVHVNDQYGIWMNMATVGNV